MPSLAAEQLGEQRRHRHARVVRQVRPPWPRGRGLEQVGLPLGEARRADNPNRTRAVAAAGSRSPGDKLDAAGRWRKFHAADVGRLIRMLKTLYVANPYGFSAQQKAGPLVALVDALTAPDAPR